MSLRAPLLPKDRLSEPPNRSQLTGDSERVREKVRRLASQAASDVGDEQDASGWLQAEELEQHLPEIGLTAQKVSGTHLRLLRADNTTSGLVAFGSASVPVTVLADTDSNLSFIS